MVAYNFDPRFAEPIRAGSKRQTIRRPRKRHARPGDELQLYTSMRTRDCALIARRWCVSVHQCRIVNSGHGILDIDVDGVPVFSLKAFCVADGFRDKDDMSDFWGLKHGEGTFGDLVLIRWRIDNADDWNRLYPVGTTVSWFEVLGQPGVVTRTRSQAWELGCGESVVLLEGGAGGKSLRHLEPIT